MRNRFDFFVELSRRKGFFEGDDGTVAAEFFNAISMLGNSPSLKNSAEITEQPFRLLDSHRIMQCVCAILTQSEFFPNFFRIFIVKIKEIVHFF